MRWIGRIILTLLTLAVVVVVGVFFIPTERIAAIASARFHEATGRTLTIKGDIRPTLYPHLGVRIADVAVSNAPWAGDAPMVRAEALSVGVAFAGLTSGNIRVEELRFVRPEIDLTRATDGRGNWELDPPATSPATTPATTQDTAPDTPGAPTETSVSVDLAQITSGRVSFTDLASGQSYALNDVDATLRLPDAGGTAELSMSARMNGQAIKLSTTIDAFTSFLAGDVRAVAATAALGGSKIGFEGRAGLSPMAADGALEAGLSDMAALFAALGQAAPELPRGLGQTADIRAQFTLAPEGSIHLRGAVIQLDQNRLTGDADLYFDEKPKLRARLAGGSMDLSALGMSASGGGGNSSGSSGGSSAATGWPHETIDASALAALDGEIAIKLDGVDLGAAQLGGTELVARLNRARMVIDIARVAAYGGTVAGEFVVNNRSGLSVGGTLRFADMALQPLLKGFADYDRLVGRGTLNLKFLGVGSNVDAIMNSLSGSGTLAIGKGELLGLDLAGMLRNLDTSYRGAGQKTIFDRVQATFTMDKGVLSNSDLDFAAPVIRASGKGDVGLGAQTLNYRVTPVALQGADGTGGISVPVIISGTWANPKFRPDLEGLIDNNFEEEKAKLEAEAKARLEAEKQKAKEKIADELGIEADAVETADDLEDALKDKAEKELKKLLGLD